MRIHDDFTAPVVLRLDRMSWVSSPSAGVERKMLDRVGQEVARATSVVRYAAGSAFPSHEHARGEEVLVLEGVFSDEHGDYPASTYVRNPWGSCHAPYTRQGCTLFVKLRQMAGDDGARVVVETASGAWCPSGEAGVDVMELHRHGAERVCLERWASAGTERVIEVADGLELFVVEGELLDAAGAWPALTWMRWPARSVLRMRSAPGCVLWRKDGPLGR